MAALPLQVIQSWMQAALLRTSEIKTSTAFSAADRPGQNASLPVEEVVTKSRHMSALERLDIYRRAYFSRLLECLQSEFPAVSHAVGEEAFAALAVGYIQARPSTSYTLNQLGDRFADHLQETRPAPMDGLALPDFADFVIELARLERTYSEVFDAPGPENCSSLGQEELKRLTPPQFAASRLVFHQTVRLLMLQFPSQDYCSAIRQGREPEFLEPATTPLVIFRRDYVVRRFMVSPRQFTLLVHLQRGETVGNALTMVSQDSPDLETLNHDVHHWFAEWTAARLFRTATLPTDDAGNSFPG